MPKYWELSVFVPNWMGNLRRHRKLLGELANPLACPVGRTRRGGSIAEQTSLIQPLCKRLDLFSEFPRTLLLKLRQVVQLPANAWKMF